MKKIFTLLCSFIAALFINNTASSQCNYTLGGDGVTSSYALPITIDGSMNDWSFFLTDADNNSYDNTLGLDLDAPVADAGRDITHFAFTEDNDYLYFYIARAGSTNNSVDIIFYADINNNNMMDSREPVIHIQWSGANGNANVAMNNYIPYISDPLKNMMLSNLDGFMLMGSLDYRGSIAGGLAKGSVDGKSIEVKIPFSAITQLNNVGETINQLAFGQDFKFHLSTINGNVSSIPGANSINDNFGGCLKAPTTVLPVHLISFQGNLNKDNKVTLNWTVADNESVNTFEVERSSDGKDFTTVGIVFASEKFGTEKYMFYETVSGTDKVMYRLKMIDKTHDIDYSRILIFNTKTIASNNIKVIGNPVNDKLTFSYTSSATQMIDVKIYDISGRTVLSNKMNSAEGNNVVNLPLASTLKTGMYVVEVNDGSVRQSSKFIKQ